MVSICDGPKFFFVGSHQERVAGGAPRVMRRAAVAGMVVALLALAVPARAVVFRVPPSAEECVGSEHKQHERVACSYRADAQFAVSVAVWSPSNSVVYRDDDAARDDVLHFAAGEAGVYRFCFSSGAAVRVRLQVTSSRGRASTGRLASAADLPRIEWQVQAATDRARDVLSDSRWRAAASAAAAGEAGRGLGMLALWRSAQIGALAGAAGVQVLYIKKLFAD